MQKPTFHRNPLAAGVALALGASAISPVAVAQDDEVIEEIITTGIRGSLMQSMDRKRDAKGVVDAITAEDIGKFPDQNLAESMSRITGVSIDRSNNEGSKITVRGMGPEFNLVTLNGRTMPTTEGRSFEFGDLASEGVRAVEIYKTGKANLPTGGIGATVNIITGKPLQSPGFRSVLSAKAVHETSSGDSQIVGLDSITPEISGMFSNTFADDTFGVLVTASYQDRNNREENAEVANWTPNAQLNGGIVNDNNQRADGVWWHPQNVGYGWAEIQRERINSQLVLQYSPIEQLTATLDYTYSEVDFEKDRNGTGIWFECPNIEATINERGTVTQVSQRCGDYSTNIGRDVSNKENHSLGLNLDYMVNDELTLTLDVHDSSSEATGGDINGEQATTSFLIIGNTSCPWCFDAFGAPQVPTGTIANQTATYGAGGIPTFTVDFEDGFGIPVDVLGPENIGSLFGGISNGETENEIMQVQLGGVWENLDSGALRRIEFGYAHTEQEYDTFGAVAPQLPAGFWNASAPEWADEIWQTGSLGSLLNGFSNGGNFSYDPYYTIDYNTAVESFETIGTNNPQADCCFWPAWPEENRESDRGRFWPGPIDTSSIVDEKIDAFYTQFVFEDEFNGRAFNAVLGVRYEETEMESYGLERLPTAVVWVGGNEFAYEFAPNQTFRKGENKNDFWLPSLDVDLEVVENFIARFSFSRTLSRPTIDKLVPNRDFVGNPNVRSRFINAGNPALLPFVSDNLDLSVEYYYGDGSYASIGYFKKKVDNFLVSRVVEETVPGIRDPYIGAQAELARQQLINEGTQPDDQAVFNRINENIGAPFGTVVRAEGGDPLVVFDNTTTTNAEVGNLFGYELAVQHMFSDTGWGLSANYTIVNGDVEANPDVFGTQFYLPGLSDSANLSVFYETDVVSARLAYNWRDKFLSGTDGNGAPVFTEAYAPLDANVTWFFNDNLDFFFEAINITEEVQRSYSRYPEQFLRGNQYGARYNIGARYNFD